MDTIIDLFACVDCHCLAARRTARAITRDFEAKLRPHGLRATQFSILAALALKDPIPVSELAWGLGLERTTLTRSAALLERNDWIGAAESTDARGAPPEADPGEPPEARSRVPCLEGGAGARRWKARAGRVPEALQGRQAMTGDGAMEAPMHPLVWPGRGGKVMS
jgi:hypothetical protein